MDQDKMLRVGAILEAGLRYERRVRRSLGHTESSTPSRKQRQLNQIYLGEWNPRQLGPTEDKGRRLPAHNALPPKTKPQLSLDSMPRPLKPPKATP